MFKWTMKLQIMTPKFISLIICNDTKIWKNVRIITKFTYLPLTTHCMVNFGKICKFCCNPSIFPKIWKTRYYARLCCRGYCICMIKKLCIKRYKYASAYEDHIWQCSRILALFSICPKNFQFYSIHFDIGIPTTIQLQIIMKGRKLIKYMYECHFFFLRRVWMSLGSKYILYILTKALISHKGGCHKPISLASPWLIVR